MPTADEAMKKMRELCAAFPDANETTINQGAEVLFRSGKSPIASCGEKKGVSRIVFQLEPDHASALIGSDPRFEKYPWGKGTVLIESSKITNWKQLGELLHESYRLSAAAKKPSKVGAAKKQKGPAKAKKRPSPRARTSK